MKEAKLQLAALPVCEDEVSRERRPSLYKRALAEDNVSWAKPDIPDEIRALLAAENGDSSTEASPPASAAATPPTLAETPPTKSLPAVGSRKKRRLTRKQIRVISTVNDDELAQISAEEVEGNARDVGPYDGRLEGARHRGPMRATTAGVGTEANLRKCV